MKKYSIAGLSICALLMLAVDWPPLARSAGHDDAFDSGKTVFLSASELERTLVVATPAAAVVRGQNVLWCATFQLAWNEARALVGEDLHFNPEPPIISELNQSTFSTNDLDTASYVALAGFVKDGIHQKIRDSLDRKFGGTAAPHFIPTKDSTTRPQDIVAYAYLFKNLEFEVPFDSIEKPLLFKGAELPAFGMSTPPKSGREQMASQVSILDFSGPDDFVIELKTKSSADHLVLAKIQPKETLAKTIESVENRTGSAQPQPCLAVDELVIPKFNFDITRQFTEIEDAKLVVHNPSVAADLFVRSAMQDIRFQMDEKGVRLKSESHISFACSAAPAPVHIMIFDKPFLVMLKRSDAKNPYFAMWVANPELFLKR
jgi:hypothetical protein